MQSDVILISCDLVTPFSLRTLTLFHHMHHSTLTALFLRPPPLDGDPMRKKTVEITSQQDLIGLAEDFRIVLFSALADLEERLVLSHSMLEQ